MSDLPPPPPAPAVAEGTPLPPPSETPPPPPPTSGASGLDGAEATASAAELASLAVKPLLNPLQAEGSAPASTIAEPPRSPNPANPAVDGQGRNVDLPPTAAATPAPLSAGAVAQGSGAEGTPVPQPSVGAGGLAIGDLVNGGNTPVPSATAAADQPPLPIDAPVPPSPPAPADEPVPSLPPSAIPSAVPTPQVIAVESPSLAVPPPATIAETPTPAPVATAAEVTPATHVAPPASEQPAAPEATPVATPAPPPTGGAGGASLAAPPTPTATPTPAAPAPAHASSVSLSPAPAPPALPTHSGSDGMDLDADGEDEVSAPAAPVAAPATGASPNALKRSADDMAGGDEKRVRDANGTAVAPAPVTAPAGAPTPAPGAAPVAYVPANYQPPPPRNPGPRTRLTQGQHKYLLTTIRSLKKMPNAIAFSAPVDVVLFNIPHYYNIVKKPMDLSTVETKLIVSNPRGPPKDKSKMGHWDDSKGKYGSVAEVTEDVRQIWENTRMFNGPDHPVSQGATTVETVYERALKNLPPEPVSAAPSPVPAPAPAPAAPSHPRRPSISQAPAPRRSEDNTDRPKREIHPPPPKELPYTDAPRKPKRRADPQVTWAAKQVSQMEKKNAAEMAPFVYPVGELIRLVDGYSRTIKKPIDLNIIKGRIAEGEYETPQQIDSDMRLMFKNAITFNPPTHEVHTMSKEMMRVWTERFKGLPPKEVPRGLSEDIGVDEMVAEEIEEDFEDDPVISMLRGQIASFEKQIETIKAERRKAKGLTAAPKKAKPAFQRKQSTTSAPPKGRSPSINGAGPSGQHGQNGHVAHAPAPVASPAPKKPRKSKDVSYKEDDGAYGDSDEEPAMSMTQKQELAEKIQLADGDTLSKAIKIIQTSTGLDGANDEIELDIDTLPPRVVSQLYNLVCRGGAPRRNGPGRPKGQAAVVGGKKPGRKATGGYGKRMMNEQEEAARIARMEAQLQSFDAAPAGQAGGFESDSSEEDESEEE